AKVGDAETGEGGDGAAGQAGKEDEAAGASGGAEEGQEGDEGQGADSERPDAGEAPEAQAQPDAEEASEGVSLGAEGEESPAEQASGDSGEAGGKDASESGQADEQPAGPEPSVTPQRGSSGDTSKRRIISPLVRRLADEHSIDLDRIDGTGTGGRISKRDVLRAVQEGGGADEAAETPAEPARAEPAIEASRPAASGGAREELVPWTNIRRRTAEHMVASHLETARAWNAVEVDWTGAVGAREAAKARFKEREGFNLTYMPFLARALCETLLEMPEVNASFDEANKANLVRHYVNLGIAVALEGGGLIVPVIKEADEKNLTGLARAISDVASRARSKQLAPDDLSGGTFTITNPGPFGSIVSVPIIPRGQTAILGFEAIKKRVIVTEEDAIAVRSIGFLTMSWDHRTIDGAEAARFLARLRERIETTDFDADLSQYLD
ncbi:MAG: 2-oxo acid dehydrogenase subunit E2, partial [Actinobacteria bacterium]|nr:2-oxo acid dehydrogenase subunit E2 [Actinomycetota bacterium]